MPDKQEPKHTPTPWRIKDEWITSHMKKVGALRAERDKAREELALLRDLLNQTIKQRDDNLKVEESLRAQIATLTAERDNAQTESNTWNARFDTADATIGRMNIEYAQKVGILTKERDDLTGTLFAVRADNTALREQREQLTKERDAALQRAETAEKSLAIIGERAMVDWDDKTVGDVDKVVPHNKYNDWLREVMKKATERDELAARLEKLKDYIRHHDICDVSQMRSGKCTCGLSALLSPEPPKP